MQADPSILSRRDATCLAAINLPWTPLGAPHFTALDVAWKSYAELTGPFNREQLLGQTANIFEAIGCKAAIYAAAEHPDAYQWRRAANYIKAIKADAGLFESFAKLLTSVELIWSGSLNQAFLDAGIEWVVVDELLLKSKAIRDVFDGARGAA